MKNTITKKELLTIKETLEALQVSTPTLRGYIKKGFLRKVRDTLDKNKVYYLKSEVDKLLSSFADRSFLLIGFILKNSINNLTSKS